jgi:aminoglycoside phosphotransferase (APT) family kinase protein
VEKAATLDAQTRREISYALIDVLAELHSVDAKAVGLGDLSRHEGYMERQIRRWTRQWADSRTQDLPLIEEIAQRLEAARPEQRGVAIVHGDYRFGNCITDFGGRRIAAVLDWELCTLGDPLADLGHLAVYWHDPRLRLPLTNDPTAAGGFASYDELLARYAERSGRDVNRIGYYRAFAAWRLAVIAEGVASRHKEHYPDDVVALEASQTAVQRLAKFALDSITVDGSGSAGGSATHANGRHAPRPDQ